MTETGAALIPNSAVWDPDIEVLTLLSMRRLELEAGRTDPLGPEQLGFIQNRPLATLLPVAAAHRCIPVLSWASGDFPASDWSERAHLSGRNHQTDRMRSANTGHRIIEIVAAVGGRPLWIKGLPLAALTTGDYSTRGRGDIDILVDRSRFAASVAALQNAGAQVEGSYSPTGSTNGRPPHRHAVNLTMKEATIDLHSRLDSNPMLMDVDHDLLFTRRARVDVGGTMVDTLGLVDTTLLLCAHAGRDAWTDLRAISDMTRLLRMVESQGELKQLQAEADAHGVSTRLGLGVLMARPFSSNWDLIESQIRISPRARFLARLAWRRLARGEQPRWSAETADIVRTYLFQVASTGSRSALRWDLEKVLMNDPSERSLAHRVLERAKTRGTR